MQLQGRLENVATSKMAMHSNKTYLAVRTSSMLKGRGKEWVSGYNSLFHKAKALPACNAIFIELANIGEYQLLPWFS